MTNESVEPGSAELVARRWSRVALAAGVAALVAAFLALMAAFGSRWGLWHYQTGVLLLRWAVYGAIGVVLLAALGLRRTRPGSHRRGLFVAAGALLLALVTIGIPWRATRAAADAPPIHDISTDTENPPTFVAVAPLRVNAANPITYGGESVARLQRQAYPDLRPAILDMPVDRAYQQALDTAEAMGWEIVVADPASGRIEATDRTFWFGFRDDVVVRLTPLEQRTVVDVRSKSRERNSDMGTNARRVRAFLEAVTG